jgi:hypothetical protein
LIVVFVPVPTLIISLTQFSEDSESIQASTTSSTYRKSRVCSPSPHIIGDSFSLSLSIKHVMTALYGPLPV